VRSRARMEEQREQALRARGEAERQRDEARAQREEALVAHRAVQRRLDATLAGSSPPSEEADPGPVRDPGPDRPIGVRSIPAVRALAPDLHRAERSGRPRVSLYDVWALRVLGSIAALCFIALLVLLLRLFL
jgi:hypothetical protein